MGLKIKKKQYKKSKTSIAERKGFEPSIPFWGIHAFQACAFDHSATSLMSFLKGWANNKKNITY
jgi:hypothetical protein